MKNYHHQHIDLLKAEADYFVHQCNCVTVGPAAGLAAEIFRLYPEANTYKKEIRRIPGTISIHGSIINLYGQQYPGKAKYGSDSKEQRLEWFREGMEAIVEEIGAGSIAIPYRIGCGLAGGNWKDYESILKSIATANPDLHLIICEL
jgi:O-acetyl-ADP-ribose deacetylase (regulator of RNase III)